MTVVVAVKVPDGAVLGTDSMTYVMSGGKLKSWSAAPKLFQLRDLPVGVMVHGRGSIGERSVGGVVRDFADRVAVGGAVDVGRIANDFFEFVAGLHAAAFGDEASDPANVIGFFVAGYGTGKPYCDGYEFILRRDAEPQNLWPGDSAKGEPFWRGIMAPLTRLHRGFDPRLPPKLSKAGLSERQIVEMLADLGSPVSTVAMPVKDAIRYVRYMLETTIGLAELAPDMAYVGRPLQVAAIVPEGFRWVTRIELD
jgi:hypothetical protein